MSQWQTSTLGECAEWLSGGTPFKGNPAFWTGTIPWVSAKDMKSFRLHDAEDHISADAVGRGGKLVPAGTVLLLVRGMTLHNDVPICVTIREMAFNQDIKAIRAKPGAEHQFLAYWLLANKPALLSAVDHAGHGTGRLMTDLLKEMAVKLPPLPEQRAIAAVLGSLDDKIELNRRMNETLEALAQSLFKSWFVDATQSALPKGWRESTIGELCEFAYGKPLKAETRRAGLFPVYGSNGQVGWHDEALVKGPGIIVGRKGNPGIVIWSPTDFFPIDTTFYVVPKGECRSLYFLFHALRAHDLASLGADSAVPGLNRNMAYMSKQVLPPSDVQEAFDKQVRPLFERVHHNNEESRTLAALRDALLPKLLSGELRVPAAAKLVEARA